MASDPNAPRLLTEEEIDYILDKSFNKPTEDDPLKAKAPISASKLDRQVMYENNIQMIRAQLSDIKITPKAIPDLIERLVYRYTKSRIEPGSAIGFLAGESLGGPVTQMALNSFHQSGSSKTVGSGIDNLRALINLTEREYTNASIHFQDKEMSFEDVLKTRKEIVSLTMLDLVEDWDIDSQVYLSDQWWYDAYMELYPKKLDGVIQENRITWFLRVKLDTSSMFTYNITMRDIQKTLEHGGTRVVTSPFSVGIIYVYIVPSALEAFTKQQKAINEDNIVMLFFQTSVVPRFNEISFKGIKGIKRLFPSEEKVYSIVLNEEKEYTNEVIQSQPIDIQQELKRTWCLYLNFAQMELTGITREQLKNFCELLGMKIIEEDDLRLIVQLPLEAPEDMKPSKWKDQIMDKEEKKEKEYKKEHSNELYVSYSSDLLQASKYLYAETNGSNLLEILKFQGVDTYHTYSNEINRVYELFGIEAARNLFILEFKKSLGDQYIDPRHIVLVADVMFNQGKPNSITFRGISRQRTSFLSLMTVEKALDVIQNVAFMGRTESVESTSASIMVNKQVLVGTGFIDVAPDESFTQTINELREKNQKINSDDLSNALTNLDTIAFGVQENVPSIEGTTESVYDMIFGEEEQEQVPLPKVKEMMILDEAPDVPMEPTIKLVPVYDPSLDIIHTNLAIPTTSQVADITQEYEEQHETSPKKKRQVKKVGPSKIAYEASDQTGVTTGLQSIPDKEVENMIEETSLTPPEKKKRVGIKKLAELKEKTPIIIAPTKTKKKSTEKQIVKPILNEEEEE